MLWGILIYFAGTASGVAITVIALALISRNSGPGW
jgi:hypothetical protein